MLKMSRPRARKLTGTVTSYWCRFKKYLNYLKLSLDSISGGCDEEDEKPLHIASQCEAFSRPRTEIFGQKKTGRT